MSSEPKLTITPEIVQEVRPIDKVESLMTEILSEEDLLCWSQYGYGSSYYVELPRYLDTLVQDGQIDEARGVIERAFGGNGIPDDDWRKMTKGK